MAGGTRGSVLVLALAAAIAGCDGGLPHDMGVWWGCTGDASRDGFLLGQFPPDLIRVCANPDVEFDDVVEACRGECESRYRAWGLFITCDVDPATGATSACHPSFTLDAECFVLSAGPDLSPAGDCAHGSIIFYQGGPSTYEVGFVREGPTASTFDLTISGHTALDVPARGALEYTVSPVDGPCPPGGCAVQISYTELYADNVSFDFGFPVGRKDVTGMIARNAGITIGTLFDDGSLVIATGAMRVSTNFDVNGEHGSTTLANPGALFGHIDRTTGAFTITDATFSSGDTSITFTLNGTATRRPPSAAFSPTAPVECTSGGGATVHLDAGLTTDPDGDLGAYYWVLPDGSELAGTAVDTVLPLGDHLVELHVIDRFGGYDTTSQVVTVVDSSLPTVVPPADVLVAACAPTVSAIGTATASDGCDGALAVVATIVEVNGLATSIPLSDAFLFPPGETVVEYRSTDGSGNTASATQLVTVAESASCCPLGLEVLAGTAGADTLIAGNQGQCILGAAGADMIDGRNSQDVVFGGVGADTALGSNATDTIDGGPDDDVLDGGNGGDLLVGGTGRDEVHGGLGPDILRIRGACEAMSGEILDGGDGPDRLESPLTLAELSALGVIVTDIEEFSLIAPEAGRCP